MRIKEICKDIFQKLALWVFIAITQVVQTIGVVAIALLYGKLQEIIVIYLSFIVGRYVLKESYHSKNLITCTIVTWLLMFFLISSVPTSEIGVGFAIIYGSGLSLILHIIVVIMDKVYTVVIPNHKHKLWRGMSEDEIVRRGNEVGLDELEIKMLIYAYTNCYYYFKIGKLINYSEDYVKHKMPKIKRKYING